MASYEIRQISEDCERLFMSLAVPAARSQPVIQVLFEQFVQWASYLGVFADEKMSLDARLMHSASVRDLVLQLLRIAHSNLERVIELEKDSDASSDVPDQESIVDQMSKQNDEMLSTPLVESLKALETALDSVDRLGVAIRQSSSASLNHRIASFMKRNDDGLVERFAFLRLKHKLVDSFQHKDLAAPPLSLCSQLAASVSFRYFCIWYQSQHQENLHRRHHGVQRQVTQSVGHAVEFSKPGPNIVSKPEMKKAIERHSNRRIQDINSVDEHSGLDSKLALLRHLSARTSFSARSGISVSPENLNYPEPPKVNPLAKEVLCPYCPRKLPRSTVEKKPLWERHLDYDLKLYACIAEDCFEPPQLFARFVDWNTHMDEKHSVRWAENVHKPVLWCCDRDHGEVVFHNSNEFDEHVREIHSEYETESEIEELKEWCEVQQKRHPYTCPVCSCVPEEVANVAPWLIPNSINEDGFAQKPKKVISASLDTELRQKLALHVASHLKVIGLMSISYLGADDRSSASGRASLGADKNLDRPEDWEDSPDPEFQDYSMPSPPTFLDEEMYDLDWTRIKQSLAPIVMNIGSTFSTTDAAQTHNSNTATIWEHSPGEISDPQVSDLTPGASEPTNRELTTLAVNPEEVPSDPQTPEFLPSVSELKIACEPNMTTPALEIVGELSNPQASKSVSSALVSTESVITTPLEAPTEGLEEPSKLQVSESFSSAATPIEPQITTQFETIPHLMTTRNDKVDEVHDDAPVLRWIVHPPTIPTDISVVERTRSLDFLKAENLSPYANQGRGILLPRNPPPSMEVEDPMEDILPHTVTANVTLSWFGNKEWDQAFKFPSFAWMTQSCYEELLPTKLKQSYQEAYKDLKDKRIYHRSGTCRVMPMAGVPIETPYRLLDDFELLTLVDTAIPLISGFIHQYPRRKFRLEIYWECGFANLDPKPSLGKAGSPTFNEMIGLELEMLQQRNFKGQSYISRRDQSTFQAYDVVENLVFYDSSLSHLNEDTKQHFVKLIIQRPALKLLLNCVFQNINLYFLHHMLLVHGMNDEKYRHKTQDCELGYCKPRFSKIWEKQSMFFAENINQGDDYRQLDGSVIMPLHHTGAGSETGPSEPGSPGPFSLGEGASSKVYRVRIDSAHHYLSGDPSCCFALKRFPSERIEEFNRERKMLKVLALYPNPDIVPCITSWSQDEEHFILYPEARYNLRQFMLSVLPVGFSKREIKWFLRQLQGLANAIDHVHDFKRGHISDEEDGLWGCHFDLKPENILVFEQVPGYHSMFKIADFGVSVFNKGNKDGVHSVLTSEARGTLTYFAPDKDINNFVSRPFDMWALGCVYLELMLWLFRFFEETGKTFSTARFEYTGMLPNSRSDKFWHKVSTAENAEYKLLPIVENVIADLRNKWCFDMPAFLDILVAVDGLLEIRTENRWTAKKLKTHMEQVVRKAKIDLELSDQYYSSRYEANIRRADATTSRASAVNEPVPDSTTSLEANNETSSQQGAISREQAHLGQSDTAAESVIGAETDPTRSADQGQHASESGRLDTSHTRTATGGDPLKQDLNEMAGPSTTSSTQTPKFPIPD